MQAHHNPLNTGLLGTAGIVHRNLKKATRKKMLYTTGALTLLSVGCKATASYVDHLTGDMDGLADSIQKMPPPATSSNLGAFALTASLSSELLEISAANILGFGIYKMVQATNLKLFGQGLGLATVGMVGLAASFALTVYGHDAIYDYSYQQSYHPGGGVIFEGVSSKLKKIRNGLRVAEIATDVLLPVVLSGFGFFAGRKVKTLIQQQTAVDTFSPQPPV